MTTEQILRDARALIATPERWTQGVIGHYSGGCPIMGADHLDSMTPEVVEDLCAFGAIRLAAGGPGDATHEANAELVRVICALPSDWTIEEDEFWNALCWQNDPETTHEAILEAFDRALERYARV